MKRLALGMVTAAALATLFARVPYGADVTGRVEILNQPAEHRVEVRVSGTPFTSYLHGTAVKKPILFPLRTARGTIVTRGFPLEPRPGEATDHPHQVGHWFNHGDVNGFDFWGHSDATPVANRPKMGTIVHTGVTEAVGGAAHGALAVTADWRVSDGSTVIRETTAFVFRGGTDWRAIDRVTTWTAAGTPVVFGDTKEGSFGIRVARALEHPSDRTETFSSAAGGKESVARVTGSAVTGLYVASDGRTGEAVWGTRGPWMALTGTVEGETVTLAILDHPSNPGHPTRWHARGYGLFSANPFGQKGFDPERAAAPVTLAAGQALRFRHRIHIHSGRLTREDVQREYDRFAASADPAVSGR